MKTLKLFNAVLKSKNESNNLHLDLTLKHGFVLTPSVAGREDVMRIINYLIFNKLGGDKLNMTFHKSWSKIENSSDAELLIDRLLHYMTTYGFKAMGIYDDSSVYIPNEILEVPDLELTDTISFKVIKGLTRDELIEKCFGLLSSGMALQEDTMNDVLCILQDELSFKFDSDSLELVKNKEAKLKIADRLNILPSNNTEFVRFLVYKATESTLLINDYKTFDAISISKLDISKLCKSYGLEKLSESFLRYKQIFLKFRKTNSANKPIVNKLRKLAKTNHKPMPVDYLNSVTSLTKVDYKKLDEELDKVNIFRKIRLLNAISLRLTDTNTRLFRIRNGKSWSKEGVSKNKDVLALVYNQVYYNMISGLNLSGLKIKLDENIVYGVPSTEKSFLGNVPTGSYIDFKENAVFGIYWENSWGFY